MYVIEVVFRGSGSWRVFSDVRDAIRFAEQRSKQYLDRAEQEGLVIRKEDLRLSLRVEARDVHRNQSSRGRR